MGYRRLTHERCTACRLHIEMCLCDELPRLSTETAVHVVSHHREESRTSSTAPLLVSMLPQAHWHIRDPKTPRALDFGADRRVFLLWPTGPVLTQDEAHADPRPITLVVPDGSWTQARRVRQRHPDLCNLTCRSVPDGPQTRFRLRTSPPHPERLCTLEAVARALGVIEGNAVESALLAALDKLVVRTLTARGLPLPHDLLDLKDGVGL